MKIFSSHRKKLEPHRRFGGREFKDKLTAAKNYKRNFNSNPKEGFFSSFLTRTGLSNAAVFTLVAIFLVIFYFLVISPYFLVTNITVNGNKQVSAEEIRSVVDEKSNNRFLLVKENNFFFLGSGQVNKLITSKIGLIRETKSIRSWPNKLAITVTERTPALVLSESDKNYLIDDQGFVVSQVDGFGNLLTVKDQVSEDISTGQTIDGKLIPFIISMEKLWPTKMQSGISLAKIPGKGAAEVEFVSTEGWSVFFSTDRPVTSQMTNLGLLLNKQIGSNRSNLAYIDLRLAKWAYYCLKSTPCQQTDQEGLSASSQSTSGVIQPPSTSGATATNPATTNK